MSNPTRQEIIDAHDALTSLLKIASSKSTASAIINERVVRAALPPKPQPTMAEIEWDDDKHYLAEATHPANGTVLMLGQDIDYVYVIREGCVWPEYPEALTLTGRRYTLTEVQE